MLPELPLPRLLLFQQLEDDTPHQPPIEAPLEEEDDRERDDDEGETHARNHEAVAADGGHDGEEQYGQDQEEVDRASGASPPG